MTATSTQDRYGISSIVEHDHEEQVAALDSIHTLAEELAGLPADRKATSIASDASRLIHAIAATADRSHCRAQPMS